MDLTNKELLLSKIYDDNIIVYNINQQRIWVKNQETEFIASYFLNDIHFCLSQQIWIFFESKTNGNFQEIEVLTGGILRDYLKRKGIKSRYHILRYICSSGGYTNYKSVALTRI